MDAGVSGADAFLAGAGWGGAARQPLAGDASARRYERLVRASGSAILMIVPPGLPGLAERFARMTGWLRGCGYSAPEILARDAEGAFTIIEDLGDGLFARLIGADNARELELCAAAVDLLADLRHRAPPGFVRTLDAGGLAGLVGLLDEAYLPALGATVGSGRIAATISSLYQRFGLGETVLCFRDFHAENLIWLPRRAGHARVGLLDYQDAVCAHPAYDLVSLLQDARRDVAPATETAMIARYRAASGADSEGFDAAYALLGAQRALRILAVFARLARTAGKPGYLRFVPRVWGHLQRDLAHPELILLKAAVDETLPTPTQAALDRIGGAGG